MRGALSRFMSFEAMGRAGVKRKDDGGGPLYSRAMSLLPEGGEVLIFTSSEAEPPETASSVEVVRHEGAVNLTEALGYLHHERGVRALLSEGGPHLHDQMQADELVDDLFLTIAPKLSGGEGPRILEGPLPQVAGLELAWLLEEDGELFARYRRP